MRVLASRFAGALWWLSPFAFLALAAAGERIIVEHPARFAIVPWTSDWDPWFRPQMQHLDQKLVGYGVMLIAATAFAFAVARPPARLQRAPPRRAARPDLVPEEQRALSPWLPAPAEIVALIVAAAAWGYALHAIGQRERDTRTLLLILLSVLVFVITLLRRDLRSRVRFSIELKRWEAALLLATIVAAALIVGHQLRDMPPSIWGDEGSFWAAAREHEPSTILRDPFRPGVYGFPFATTLPPALASSTLGHTVFAWRVSSVAFVVITVPVLYFLARHLFDRTAAFASAFLFVSSPYLLAFGRSGYNNIQALFPAALSAALSLAALQRRSALLFFAAGAAAGLAFYTYSAARLAPMLIGVLLIHAGVVKRCTWREAGLALALAALGTIMVGLPPFLGALVDPTPVARTKMIESLFLNEAYVRAVFPDQPVETFRRFEWQGAPFLFDPMITLRLLLRGIVRTLLSFHDADLVSLHFIRGPLGGRWTSALLLPGIALGLSRIRSSGHAMLLAWTVLAMLLLSIFNAEPPHHAHMVVIIPALAIWCGAAIGALAVRLGDLQWRGAQVAARISAVIVVAALTAAGVREYRSNAPDFLAHAEMAVWWEAMDLEQGEYVVWVHTEPHYLEPQPPLGIRMFDLEDHYRYVPLDRMLDPASADDLEGASVVIVAVIRAPDPATRDFPLEVARFALPEWSLEPLTNVGVPRGWIFRPPQE